jgi:hypothetical protein
VTSFWGMEDLIRRQPGVVDTRVGYTGGENDHATYRNHPGHAEAVEIGLDPEQTTFRDILLGGRGRASGLPDHLPVRLHVSFPPAGLGSVQALRKRRMILHHSGFAFVPEAGVPLLQEPEAGVAVARPGVETWNEAHVLSAHQIQGLRPRRL